MQSIDALPEHTERRERNREETCAFFRARQHEAMRKAIADRVRTPFINVMPIAYGPVFGSGRPRTAMPRHREALAPSGYPRRRPAI